MKTSVQCLNPLAHSNDNECELPILKQLTGRCNVMPLQAVIDEMERFELIEMMTASANMGDTL